MPWIYQATVALSAGVRAQDHGPDVALDNDLIREKPAGARPPDARGDQLVHPQC
jgi:hypothetical protein